MALKRRGLKGGRPSCILGEKPPLVRTATASCIGTVHGKKTRAKKSLLILAPAPSLTSLRQAQAERSDGSNRNETATMKAGY